MRAVGYRHSLPIEHPESLIDCEVPDPPPQDRDLLVRVEAVSINPVDAKVRASEQAPGEIHVIGFDAAGVVADTGAACRLFQPGDRVFYAGSINRPGSNAARQVVDERIVGHMPRTLSYPEAAALPLTSITAWEALFDKLQLSRQSRGTLLIIGASGGVGSMVVQLAAALLPEVRVIATASRPEASRWVSALGADMTVDHRADLRQQVQVLAPAGIDWIFSAHSVGLIETYVEILKPFGAIVAIDDPDEVNVMTLKQKALSFHWEMVFTRSLEQTPDMSRQHEILERIAELVDRGIIRTTVAARLSPIGAEQLREGHRMIETGHTIGKIVVAGWT